MKLDEIDKIGLIRESYVIEGITPSQCRSIFFDWALKLPVGTDEVGAINLLIKTYGADADHPMTNVLNEALGSPERTGRRGGRAARVQY